MPVFAVLEASSQSRNRARPSRKVGNSHGRNSISLLVSDFPRMARYQTASPAGPVTHTLRVKEDRKSDEVHKD